uniref:RING-type domain-containing protein n=1 Tax=Aureoumbra lagunensis TaxID=44058 RepID=A0A7S3NQC4_9STRA|mmetsp:Transcript_10548/g.15918  ORF Transcript_10548/g.15918 Transcript_10548/m.15918 type:complete len:445 (+) Transcript_10548:662-1996(+)
MRRQRLLYIVRLRPKRLVQKEAGRRHGYHHGYVLYYHQKILYLICVIFFLSRKKKKKKTLLFAEKTTNNKSRLLSQQFSSGLEIASYVLWAELLNSTALAVYALAFTFWLFKVIGSATTRRLLLAIEATIDALSRQEVRVAFFAALALSSWLILGDALELVRRAQQCVFALFAMRWAYDAIIALRFVWRAFLAMSTRAIYFLFIRITRWWQNFFYHAQPNPTIFHHDENNFAQRLHEFILPHHLELQRLAAEINLQNVGLRNELMAMLRLFTELLAPIALVALALAFGAICIIPFFWAAGLVSENTRLARWDQIIEMLANDDTPSSTSVFAMNALLVATTLAPLLNAEARRNAKLALSKLAVQLHRRLLAKPVPPRIPNDDDLCAICLIPLKDDDKEHSPQQNTQQNLLFCRYGCGKAVHAECMQTWLKQKNECVFCGTLWSDD